MRFHLEMEVEKNVERGTVSRGGAPRGDEELRRGREVQGRGPRPERRRGSSRRSCQDVRYGLRALCARTRRSPLAAIVTLALGIGANTAIFSVVNGVLLQSLPYGGGERLVRLRADAPGANIEDAGFSPLELADYRAQTRTLRRASSEYHSMWFVLLGGKEPERVQTGVVSANFFDVLGVKPLLGRTFRKGEDAHGAEAVLVLSYAYWMRELRRRSRRSSAASFADERPPAHGRSACCPRSRATRTRTTSTCPSPPARSASNPRLENNRREPDASASSARLKPGVTLAAARTDLDDGRGPPRSTRVSRGVSRRAGSIVTPVSLREEMTQGGAAHVPDPPRRPSASCSSSPARTSRTCRSRG